jgi:hypothetical protein
VGAHWAFATTNKYIIFSPHSPSSSSFWLKTYLGWTCCCLGYLPNTLGWALEGTHRSCYPSWDRGSMEACHHNARAQLVSRFGVWKHWWCCIGKLSCTSTDTINTISFLLSLSLTLSLTIFFLSPSHPYLLSLSSLITLFALHTWSVPPVELWIQNQLHMHLPLGQGGSAGISKVWSWRAMQSWTTEKITKSPGCTWLCSDLYAIPSAQPATSSYCLSWLVITRVKEKEREKEVYTCWAWMLAEHRPFIPLDQGSGMLRGVWPF